MSSCSAIGCTNRSKKYKNISFYRVPSKKAKQVILYEIGAKYKVNRKIIFDGRFFTRGFHFNESCFRKDLMIIILALLYLFKFVSPFLKI